MNTILKASFVCQVLVSVPDMETAQEIVKVHAFIPAKIKDSELKLIHLKQHIGMDTPVGLSLLILFLYIILILFSSLLLSNVLCQLYQFPEFSSLILCFMWHFSCIFLGGH